jgi:hypothetical protein
VIHIKVLILVLKAFNVDISKGLESVMTKD